MNIFIIQVDQVRSQCNERIQKLTEEVHALEMDSSEKQDKLEKAIRDKRAAESELEKVCNRSSYLMLVFFAVPNIYNQSPRLFLQSINLKSQASDW